MKLPYTIRSAKSNHDKTFEPNHNVIWGKIISVEGSIYPPNEINKVWVQEFANPTSILVAKYDNILPVENLPVLIGADPQPPYRKIIGLYTATVPPTDVDDTARFTVPNHAFNHQWPNEVLKGPDAVAIFQPAIHILKTSPTKPISNSVYVYPAIILHDNSRQTFNGRLVDLTSYIPSVGNHTVVLICLDVATMTISVIEGVVNPTSVTKRYPDIPNDVRPSAFVTLTGGQLITVNDIEDTRDFINTTQSSTYSANRTGEILISNDGASFESQRPVTSSHTFTIVLTSEGEIVTV